MPTNFLWAAGNDGYLSPAPLTGTFHTATSTALTSISPAVSISKGTMVMATGVPLPNFITTTVSTSATATLLTAATATATVAYSFLQTPILIGGEASALTNGSAVTSSYWNGNGIFRQSNELLQALMGSIWLMTGTGTFLPVAGGVISGWWLPSIDGGTTFETAVDTASTTVTPLARPPDFVIPLGATANTAGNLRFSSGRVITPPPESNCKVIIQNNSGTTMPATWGIGLGPATFQY